ncbi:MAG: polysaccharide biosynthesis tyrosine autokinase [Burkholderiaceae bacterium]|nr:MAG: polysaccharide biosynthesis tyrosine autokinase [Burkholderiaceae bacterium]
MNAAHPIPLPVQQQGDEADDEINLIELLNIVLQRRWLVAAVFVVILLAGTAYAILAHPIYAADALIQVEDKVPGSRLGGLSQLTESLGLSQNPVSGEIEILRSRGVLTKAINETQANVSVHVDNRFPLIGAWVARRNEARQAGLAQPLWGLSGYAWGGEHLRFAQVSLPERQWNRAFYLQTTPTGYTVLDSSGRELARGAVGERVAFTLHNEPASITVQELEARPGTRFRFTEQSLEQTTREVRAALSVTEAGKQSGVIQISIKNPSDAFAVHLINAVADAYLAQNVERRSAEARSSLKFLEQQLPALKDRVNESEDALSKYRMRSSTIAVDKEAEELLKQATTLENNRLQLRLKRDELAQRFRPDYPELKALDNQIAVVNKAIAELDKATTRLPKAQRELLPYERDARVNAALYVSLLNNAQQLRVAEAGMIGNVRIVDHAVVSGRPVEPKRPQIVALAAVLGLILGLFSAFVAHFMRPTLQRSDQIEQLTGLSTYATIPESERKGIGARRFPRRNGHSRRNTKGLLALATPQDPAVESLRSLRTGLTFALMGSSGNVVAFTGATSGVGKSFISSNFAALMADSGKRVVLVDTDMRKPHLHDVFDFERTTPGLSSVLAGSESIDSLLRATGVSNLTVLPAGVLPPNPSELLLHPRFAQLVQALSSRFDLVVFDTPPILPVADVLAVMQHVSVAFLIVRAEYSTAREVRDALLKLRNSGVAECVKGAIFNGVRGSQIGYGRAYKYYYSYR